MSTATADQIQTHQEQLARLRAEVASLQAQLDQANKLATIGTMTAMVAHEFNNILTPIINYARMARNNPALVGKALDRAADGGKRATSICSALLGTVRAAPEACEPVDLQDLVERTLDAMARRPEKDSIALSIDVPAELSTTSPVEFQQILLNLLLNARTALMQSAGPRRIAVSARPDGDQILIEVADNGVGIGADQHEKIFQPFHSNYSAVAGSEPGTGLGLAFCRRVLQRLGGSIAVDSQPGEGAVFTVRLPR